MKHQRFCSSNAFTGSVTGVGNFSTVGAGTTAVAATWEEPQVVSRGHQTFMRLSSYVREIYMIYDIWL